MEERGVERVEEEERNQRLSSRNMHWLSLKENDVHIFLPKLDSKI